MTIPGKGGSPSGPRTYFSKVKQAREAIKERAIELVELQFQIIVEAIAKGQLEVAAKANQFLLEHAAEDEEGNRILDMSIDKPKVIEGYQGPSIQIGLNLGGMNQPKALPKVTEVPIEPEPESK